MYRPKKNDTILFGCSGFFGPIILENYPNIIAAGRTPPPKYIKNKYIKVRDSRDLNKRKNFNFKNVIFLIGNSHHSVLNSSSLDKALSYNFYPLKDYLEFFIKKKVKRVIIFSGALIYGKKNLKLPVNEKQKIDGYQNNYLFSKYLSEQIAEFYRNKINIINVRLSNIYGPTHLKRPDLIQEILNQIIIQNKKQIYIKNFRPKRDFIYAKDAADALIKLLKTNYSGNINLGSGKMYSIKQVCEIIKKYTGVKINSKNNKVGGQMKFVFDINKIKKIAKWKPKYSLEQGIRLTIDKLYKIQNEIKKK